MGNAIEPSLVIFPHFPFFFMLQELKFWQRALTLNNFARREKKNYETLAMAYKRGHEGFDSVDHE